MNEHGNNQIKNVATYFMVTIFALLFLSSCGSHNAKNSTDPTKYTTLKLDKVSSDSTEYDIIITDAGYDSFLATQKPMDFYSQRYYENWNRYYVIDWNNKVRNSAYHSIKYQNIFDMYIDYDPSTDYGMEVNYKLYYYFRFVEERYGVRFNIPRAISY